MLYFIATLARLSSHAALRTKSDRERLALRNIYEALGAQSNGGVQCSPLTIMTFLCSCAKNST